MDRWTQNPYAYGRNVNEQQFMRISQDFIFIPIFCILSYHYINEMKGHAYSWCQTRIFWRMINVIFVFIVVDNCFTRCFSVASIHFSKYGRAHPSDHIPKISIFYFLNTPHGIAIAATPCEKVTARCQNVINRCSISRSEHRISVTGC